MRIQKFVTSGIRNFYFFILLFLSVCLLFTSVSAQDEFRIWNEFINTLKAGKMTIDKIRPHEQLGEKYKPILLGYLDSVRFQASAEDWETVPEVIQIDNGFQYIVPWTTGNQKVTYCFSFITEGVQWYFQHLEAIFIRLDKISDLPASTFPDVSDVQKNWIREETYWSFIIINFYLPVAREQGSQYALDLLKDGGGYFVAAKTWVPFVPAHKAFILYLCWEQSNLRGNEVILEKLDDAEAIVHLDTHYFALYKVTAHLKSRISLEDYKRIFETIWHDRATYAGWDLDIQYTEDLNVIFVFKQKTEFTDAVIFH